MGGSTRWQDLAGDDEGEAYAARLAARAATGADMHGEADRVESVLGGRRGRVLDAGCGTGRVVVELARRGHDVVGVDLDPSMLAVARRDAPELVWVQADLADLGSVDLGAPFDVVVCAGNVVPLLADGTEADAIRGMAGVLRPGGRLVCGFGLDVAHLPLDHVPVTLADHDAWCAEAGLVLEQRFATWEGAPFDDGGYHVSVHRSCGEAEVRASPDAPR